jgi:hypothetical protein
MKQEVSMTPNNREELVELMAAAMGLEEPNEFWRDTARAVLTALDTAGIDLVPRVATEEMLDATALDDGSIVLPWRYTAMLTASPFRPKQQGGGED